MAPRKPKVSIPGVAEGQKIIGVPTGEGVSAAERVEAFLSGSMSEEMYQGWGAALLRGDIQLVSATSKPAGKAIFSFTTQPEHANRLGNLHGGCCATIFDICTTSALVPIAKPGYWAFAGVSRTLNVTYLRPIPIGETVLVESEVVHAGKRLACIPRQVKYFLIEYISGCTIKGEMKRKSDGALMAICEHGKVSIDIPVSKL